MRLETSLAGPAANHNAPRQLLRLRDRLEAGRAMLLGPYSRLPAPLRHYAVSLTEVQWLLDAWIAGARTEDGAQLRHDFFQAAWSLFETCKARPEPRPNPRSAGLNRWPARLLNWWHAVRGGGKGRLLGRPGQAGGAG